MDKKVSADEIRQAKGYVNVVFEKEHGTHKKGDKEMHHKSTALALQNEGIVKITGEVKEVRKPKR